MVDVLLDLCGSSGREDGKAEVDILKCVGKATLDIIGVTGLFYRRSFISVGWPWRTGFDYDFNSLGSQNLDIDKLYRAVYDMFNPDLFTISFFIQLLFPATRMIVSLSPPWYTYVIQTVKALYPANGTLAYKFSLPWCNSGGWLEDYCREES